MNYNDEKSYSGYRRLASIGSACGYDLISAYVSDGIYNIIFYKNLPELWKYYGGIGITFGCPNVFSEFRKIDGRNINIEYDNENFNKNKFCITPSACVMKLKFLYNKFSDSLGLSGLVDPESDQLLELSDAIFILSNELGIAYDLTTNLNKIDVKNLDLLEI